MPLGRWRWLAFAAIIALAVAAVDRAARRHRAALVRVQLGLRRQPRRSADARATSARVFDAADARARDLQHRPDRRRSAARSRSRATRRSASRRIAADGWSRVVDYLVLVPRAMPGIAGRPRVLLGVPVLPAAEAVALRRSSACGSPTRWCGSPYGMRLVSASLLQVGAGARGGGAHRRREPRPRRARRHAAADPPRAARAAGCSCS